jgi:pyruvate,water dikinase
VHDDYVRWFKDLRQGDVPLVGGKNAALGEMYAALTPLGVKVPNGFAVTAAAYRDALNAAGAWNELHRLLDGLDKRRVAELSRRAVKARRVVYEATAQPELGAQIAKAYRDFEREYGPNAAVAVRSSATAEDLPEASFAGQHDSYLNVRGARNLVEACRRCFASIFTDRAISYRIDHGFDHFKVALSVGVMKMVRSDRAASGVVFTLDTESGFPDVVFITGAYGLGENIVQGKVDPDQFYVHKPTFRNGHRAVLSRTLGGKQLRMVYGTGLSPTRNTTVNKSDRARFCIGDAEVLKLAQDAISIEDHYSARNGRPTPMDVEWAKDGPKGELFVVQARPETVASRRRSETLEIHTLKGSGPVLARGNAVGEKIAAGPARIIRSAADLPRFRQGEVLVAQSTSPDWEPVMKKAAAIVTDRGGRTCHAAIVARELGVPAVVGAQGATRTLKNGADITVSCAEGESGQVYAGRIPFEVTHLSMADVPHTRTEIMLNLGNPQLAFRTAMLPSAGVGLARMEFIISEHIGIHPMALVAPHKIRSARVRAQVRQMTRGYRRAADFFVQRLAEGVGTIAAAFYPRPVIVRLSDFKTNEYASLIGGRDFEPVEANPMIGFRGAARYLHPAYAAGFALECAALKQVRQEMGLVNLRIMVPFCRRVQEAEQVIATMAAQGLKRGENGLEIYVMCEIPNNVIQVDGFAKLFDGFSIGSNDLTQLTLGVDRDSEIVAFDFDERDPGMLEMLRLAVSGAKRNGRHIGICGEAPANYQEIARFLAGIGIDSISVNPGSLLRTISAVHEAETAAASSRRTATG